MSWQQEMVTMLRVLISDMDSECYTDARLEQLLVLSGKYVQQEISFDTTYTISVAEISISPDPTSIPDEEFMNFTVLKAACLTDWNTFRQKALLAGLKARCGPAILETVGHLDGFKDLIDKGPCAAYEELKKDYQFGNTDTIRAVLSPFIGNNFDPSTLSPYRGRYNNNG